MKASTKYAKKLGHLIDQDNAIHRELFSKLCDQLAMYEECVKAMEQGVLLPTERGALKMNPALGAMKLIAELVLKYLKALDVKVESKGKATDTLDDFLGG